MNHVISLLLSIYKKSRYIASQAKQICTKAIFETFEGLRVQNSYDLSKVRSAKKLVVFLIPGRGPITGGLISIYKFYDISKGLCKDSECLLVTTPGLFTKAKMRDFESTEKIYRWDQIVQNLKNCENLIIHVPEYYAGKLYVDLKESQLQILAQVPSLRINILNQNILLMPRKESFTSLFKLTKHVTQSVGFKKSATQEICDEYGLPVYRLPSYIDLEDCKRVGFSNKKNTVLYSPDVNPEKNDIVAHLKSKLTDFEVVEIRGLTYPDFLQKIAESKFCISFGEGFDGFYIQPYYGCSIGATVFNNLFFPSEEYRSLPFVYESYGQMKERIADDILKYSNDESLYSHHSDEVLKILRRNINKVDETRDGLDSFYREKPTFTPNVSSLASV